MQKDLYEPWGQICSDRADFGDIQKRQSWFFRNHRPGSSNSPCTFPPLPHPIPDSDCGASCWSDLDLVAMGPVAGQILAAEPVTGSRPNGRRVSKDVSAQLLTTPCHWWLCPLSQALDSPRGPAPCQGQPQIPWPTKCTRGWRECLCRPYVWHPCYRQFCNPDFFKGVLGTPCSSPTHFLQACSVPELFSQQSQPQKLKYCMHQTPKHVVQFS